MKEEERGAWEAIKEGITALEEDGIWIKEEKRIEKKEEDVEGVLGSERKMISGSLNSQSISLEVSKPGCQEEPRRKKLLEEENARKTAMLMGRKGGLGSGALGPNIDPNPDVPLKRIIKIKQTSVPEPLYMLVNRVTGAKTGESIVMELERGTCSPRSRREYILPWLS